MISRTYIVSYYAERNDECVDREIEIEAQSIAEAVEKVKYLVLVYSRVFRVEEKSIGLQQSPTVFWEIKFSRIRWISKSKRLFLEKILKQILKNLITINH